MFAFLAHAGVGWAAGGYIGVDMFFVISGFLITGLLLKEMDRTGTASLARFYAHRAKRLLPLAAVVLATVAVLSAIMLSPVRRELIAGDILAATVYVVNWHFAAESVDYFAAGVEGSPVLHFWSLSIEEQFYLVWPVLLLAVTLHWRRRGLNFRPAAFALVTILGVASLIYSIYYSQAVPAAAYYSTFTRVYEISVGAAIAVLALRPKPTWIWSAIGAVALLTFFWYVLTFDETVAYPSYLGLIPSLATGAFILAGSIAGARMPLANRLVALRPFRYVGRVSYAWYMWHWPAIVFAEAQWGPLTVEQRLLAIAVAGIPTVVTHHLIEQPIRYSKVLKVNSRKALAVGFGSMATALVAAAALVISQPPLPSIPAGQVAGATAMPQNPELGGNGAGDQGDDRPAPPQRRAEAINPNPLEARDDSPLDDGDCWTSQRGTEPPRCVFGDPDSKVTVVITGDSHALHYVPAMDLVGKKRGWRVLAPTKMGCPPYRQLIYNRALDREYTECIEWQRNLVRWLERERPNMIIATGWTRHRSIVEDGTMLDVDDPRNIELLERGYEQHLEQLRHTGARIVMLKDTPRAPFNVPECVADNLDDLRQCTFDIPAEHDRQSFEARVSDRVTGARLIDIEPAFCPDRRCHAVIGDALVFRDSNHFTRTFSRTLAGSLDDLLPRPN